MMKLTRLILCGSLLGLVSVAPGAPAPDRFAAPEWSLLDLAPSLRAAAAITPAAFPDCDDATVDEKTLEVYQPDGTALSQDETFTKMLTEKGRRDNAVIHLGFLLPYFTVEVSRLEVIKPDGRVVAVDVAANSKESIDDSQMQENIYDPNSRVLQVNVPGLEVGDIVHFVTRTVTSHPLIPGGFGNEFMFEGRGYIRHISCEIRAPAAKPLLHAELRDPVKGTVTYTTSTAPDGFTVHHWEVNRVPRMYDEPAMPPDDMVLQRLVASTLQDWPAVSRWYWGLSQSHLDATTPEMKKVVDRLIAGDTTEAARINAVFQYVSRNIRYMGVTPEKDSPGFEPHDVRLTFAKKYGVCRDKAALLVAMLNLAGEKAYPVLINVGSRLDPDVPNPFFNHAIVAVQSAPGKYVLMDPTDEHTRDLLPAYDDNQSYLVCRPGGDGLRLSPVSPPEENMMRITTAGTLGDDGGLTATTSMDFTGVNDDAYRGALAEMKPDDRLRFFAARLQRIMPGARLVSLKITPDNILDESIPLHAEMTFAARGMAAFGGDTSVVTLPWLGRSFGVVNYILDGTGLDKRKYPLETQVTCGVAEKLSLKLAPNFERPVSVPSSLPQDNDCVAYQRRIDFRDQTLEGSRELALKVVEFSPAQYLELKQMLRDVALDERKMPVIATAGPPPAPGLGQGDIGRMPAVDSNAQVVEDQHVLTVTDAHDAVLHVHYLKKVLTYKGKITEAEVKIPYNPATADVKILHAWVTSPAGQRQEVSADETNVMDEGWNASAKRYTGGKVLVDSLPGAEIGSTIDVECEIRMHGVPYLAGFEPFQLPDEVGQKSLQITAPAGLALELRQSGPKSLLTETRTAAGDRQIIEWQAQGITPLPEEANPPPDWTYRAGIGYFVGDPAAYWRDLNGAMLAHAAHGAKAAQRVHDLAGPARSRIEALQAIRDYVVKAVRLAGPSFTDLPLGELSDADTTLADGYGHQADRAILLHAMLAADGFAPQFVLASDLPPIAGLEDVARSFPLPDDFQEPLVRVDVDGQTYYLNDTDQYARLGSTPHDDRMAILLADGSYDTIHAIPEDRSRVVSSYTLTVADDGNARIGIRHEYFGMAYDEANRRFAEFRPEERDRYYQQTVAAVAQGARADGPLSTNFDAYPGVVQYTVNVGNYGIADGKFLYLNLPANPPLFVTQTDRRSLPLFMPSNTDDTVRATVQLPPHFRQVVIAPRSASLQGPDGAGGATISATGLKGEYDVTYELDRSPAIIAPADYPKALNAESALENRAARVLLLEKTAPDPAVN